MQIDVLTVFPAMLDGFIRESMLKRAVSLGKVRLNTVDLRDFTQDAHRTTDTRPYGGGPGMVMKPEPIVAAEEAIQTEESRVILMSPQGRVFKQDIARELVTASHLIFICGHYEGIDERVRELLHAEELSIGDYVLTNGVLPAAVVVDAVVRLLPGVLGGEGATEEESFSEDLLEYPQYTRPLEYRGMRVPEVLRSGNHAAIAAWRREQAEARTRERRKDLLQ
jgi:tRNA (guanine37-N1)-methyltransferase